MKKKFLLMSQPSMFSIGTITLHDQMVIKPQI